MIAVEAAMLAVLFAVRERIVVVVTSTVVTGRVSQQSVCVLFPCLSDELSLKLRKIKFEQCQEGDVRVCFAVNN